MKVSKLLLQVAQMVPSLKIHPGIAAFLKDYMSNEKLAFFRGRFVVNTHFPPFPSTAAKGLVKHFQAFGETDERRLYSVTLAVTNRCDYKCWHCYNAGRTQEDMPFDAMRKIAAEIQEMGAVIVELSGGEPFLRNDLAEIVGLFDGRSCLSLATSGAGMTPERARTLRDGGLFAVGVSLDSTEEEEHDRMRGVKGAFRTALRAIEAAAENGLYPFVISLATRRLLQHDRFMSFMDFAGRSGAREVRLVEPCATGRLVGRTDLMLSEADRKTIVQYQKEIAQRKDLPILSSYTYLESAETFGCGAGLTHLYIDGSGEVCPCNLIPLSFGNVTRNPLRDILDRMARYFRKPRAECAARTLAEHVPAGRLPVDYETSCGICEKHLPRSHGLPRFFLVRSEVQEEIGREELRRAYDSVHGHYDDVWLTEAGKPVAELVEKLQLAGDEKVLDVGCGTGYATALIAGMLGETSQVLAVDISEGMLNEARERVQSMGINNVRFANKDAIDALDAAGSLDLVFSSWVIGLIPMKPFLAATGRALQSGGRLAFIVHRRNSPAEVYEILGEILAQDPTILQKSVGFDFPRDADHARSEIELAGLDVEDLWEGSVVFRFDSPEAVLEHLQKSGTGAAIYEAIDPARRESLQKQFVELLADRRNHAADYRVRHEYIACIARKP